MFLEYKIQFWNISNKERKKNLNCERVTYIHYVQSSLVLPDPTFYLYLSPPRLSSLLQLFLAGAVVWVVIFLALSRPVARVVVLVIVILLISLSLCSCSLQLFSFPFLLKLFTVVLLQLLGFFDTCGLLYLVLILEVDLQLFY